MNPNLILWIYIGLLVAGGMVGFLKAGSKISLITSVVAAGLLSLCATGIIFQRQAADVILAILLILFGWRLSKSKKFMPSGLLVVLTTLALIFRNVRF